MKFATCNEMFEGWPVERQFQFSAECGYQGLEIAPFTIARDVRQITPQQRREVRRLAGEHGVDVIGLHWLLVGPEGMHITDPNQEVRSQTVDYLEALMRCCADLGGQVLVFGSPKQRNVQEGVTREQARQWLIDGFSQALRVAEEVGVTLCLEPLPPPDCNFILTTSEAIDVIDTIDHPNLRLILDVKSMFGEQQLTGRTIPDTIRAVAPYVRHMQANDANLGYPGSGEIDFVPIFRALREVGYDGFVSVEVFDFSPGPETIARKSIEYMRRCYAAAGGK